MVGKKYSTWRLKKTLSVVLVFVGVVSADVSKIAATIPYFQRPKVVYSTEELATYPIIYQENKPVLTDIQGRMLVDGPIKILDVVVRNEGERGAHAVCVRIPFFSNDGYLGGWMWESQSPSESYMIALETQRCFHELMPGDEVRLYLYLRNVNSQLANRIDVFDGEGRRAPRNRYVPVGSDEITVSLGRCLSYLFGVILLVTLGFAGSVRKTRLPPISGDGERPVDASAHLPGSSPGPPERDDGSRRRYSSDWTAGGM